MGLLISSTRYDSKNGIHDTVSLLVLRVKEEFKQGVEWATIRDISHIICLLMDISADLSNEMLHAIANTFLRVFNPRFQTLESPRGHNSVIEDIMGHLGMLHSDIHCLEDEYRSNDEIFVAELREEKMEADDGFDTEDTEESFQGDLRNVVKSQESETNRIMRRVEEPFDDIHCNPGDIESISITLQLKDSETMPVIAGARLESDEDYTEHEEKKEDGIPYTRLSLYVISLRVFVIPVAYHHGNVARLKCIQSKR